MRRFTTSTVSSAATTSTVTTPRLQQWSARCQLQNGSHSSTPVVVVLDASDSPAQRRHYNNRRRSQPGQSSLATTTTRVATGTQQQRHLARLRETETTPGESWFTPSGPAGLRVTESGYNGGHENHNGGGSHGDHKPPDERTLRLGKTLRTLSPLLPNILTTPLPPSILSPNISLHLFPSTHPHLPTVKGRVAYRAALWTAPVAWGSVPILGNLKLHILSERVVRTGTDAEDISDEWIEEKLVVRWKTEEPTTTDATSTHPPFMYNNTNLHNQVTSSSSSLSTSSSTTNTNPSLSTLLGGSTPLSPFQQPTHPFSGLFIFQFDHTGRIASHTIEHADEGNGYDRTAKVVSLTDWLLGKTRWGLRRNREGEEEGNGAGGGVVPGLCFERKGR